MRDDIPTPDILPCSSDNAALRWGLSLGKVVDPEESAVTVDLDCPTLPFGFFNVKFAKKILELAMNGNSVDILSG